MHDTLKQSLVEVLDFLQGLQRDGMQPDEARARLQGVRERFPALKIDLLAEVEAYDKSVHYDALIGRAGEGTVSLSYCPERALPWPLRGVHRWSETDLVRINGNVLHIDKAIACLDFIWDEAPIIERLVNLCLIQEELDREPIELSDDDLRQAMKNFRKAKNLFKAEDTFLWLERHGMSVEKLERYVGDESILAKLRDRIAGEKVEEYFRGHATDFDAVSLARFEVADEGRAHELAERIRAGEQDFISVAERCYLEAVERGVPLASFTFEDIERRRASPELREVLFATPPGQLAGPVRFASGHALMRVMARRPARLDERTRSVIKEILFDEWLAERRRAARIEWCWGNAGKTG
jgi:putative peptide maturation system protein